MQKDPACGMEVNEKDRNTLTASVSGRSYYFCSNDCKSEFLKKRK